MMKSFQPWMGSRVTVHPDCAPHIAENIEHLFSLGINQFIIGPAHGEKWTKETIREYEASLRQVCLFYLEQKRAHKYIRLTIFELGDIAAQKDKYRGIWGCGAGRGRVCVSAKGDLFGCSKLLGLSGVDKGLLKLGNVWDGMTNLQNRMILTDATDTHRYRCQSCKLANSCTGNCVATNYDSTGDIFESSAIDCAFIAMYERINDYLLSVASPEDLELLKITPEKTAGKESKVEDLTRIGSGPTDK
jgi:radical SAM protein with 4Fe4S-binding SPASM domain